MSDYGTDDQPLGAGRPISHVRKTRIIELVHQNGFMSPTELANLFDVSEMTIRRDLAELAMRGEIQRVHGGAISDSAGNAGDGPDRSFHNTGIRNAERKYRIARTALDLVRPAQAVALDSGTTVLALAEELTRCDTPMRLFTNNLGVATLEPGPGHELYLIGGRLRESDRALGGAVGTQQVRKLWFDIAFLGVSSVTQHGFFDSSIEGAYLKHLFTERSTRRVFLVDSSKFETRALVQVAKLSECDTLVTDASPPPQLGGVLAKAGVEVLVAED